VGPLSRIYEAIKDIDSPFLSSEQRLLRLRSANLAANELIKRKMDEFQSAVRIKSQPKK
jgi:hypothetical protein